LSAERDVAPGKTPLYVEPVQILNDGVLVIALVEIGLDISQPPRAATPAEGLIVDDVADGVENRGELIMDLPVQRVAESLQHEARTVLGVVGDVIDAEHRNFFLRDRIRFDVAGEVDLRGGKRGLRPQQQERCQQSDVALDFYRRSSRSITPSCR
jgi:hypothetical protein